MTSLAAPTDAAVHASLRVHRVEVHPQAGQPDPLAATTLRDIRTAQPAIQAVHTARIYLIQAPLDEAALRRIAEELLADPVSQQPVLGVRDVPAHGATLEVHYQPGVMDPVAQSTADAILEMCPRLTADQVQVRTGFRYDFLTDGLSIDAAALRHFAATHLANPVIQDVHDAPFAPERFPLAHDYHFRITHVAIRGLDDDGLRKLSREGHLFLSLEEMQAIQRYFREADRDPTDIELETLAQTWSEHCVHKTLKSRIRYEQPADGPSPSPRDWAGRPGHTINDDASLEIDNLLRSTIAAATHKLMTDHGYDDWCVSVFKDNAGIVRFDEEDGVCIKVETHNHPSAIEPYGGAATGIGGCIRDVLGTGLAARPIANTNVFCVADPNLNEADLPKGVIHPRRILQQVVAGVRDYGNRKGIPTVAGGVAFHDRYLGNPLVFAGCVGIMPLDKCFGAARPGDRIIALGGATGRDGIHGATFSSAELTDTHADEFSHAVQIGNAITQKKVLDVILQARDHADGCLFNAITDCGAGGFSSAVGEMGEKIGARVTLETAPLKYAGLSYTEIWISEAQERMVLAVPPDKVDVLRVMCEAEDVAFCDLGQFGWHADGPGEGDPLLVLTYHGQEVGRLAMNLLHEGIPQPTRTANWAPPKPAAIRRQRPAPPRDLGAALHGLLSHPNIASKHWIIRQYDHEVQGGSTIKPLVGPGQDGPSDAAVIRPKLSSRRGVAIGSGLATSIGEAATADGTASDGDSYWMTLAAIDEVVRNLVCVGADPRRIAILDNFCWPSCDDPTRLATLVRAAEACYDGALAYGTPFVSGKDSLNNQFTTDDGKVIAIPPTLLISGLGIVPDVARCRTMDAKAVGNLLLLVGPTDARLGGSHYLMTYDDPAVDRRIARLDLRRGPRTAGAVAAAIERGLVASAHDCSDGGMLVAAAEMAFAGRIGLDLDLDAPPADGALPEAAACFAETPSRFLLEVAPDKLDATVAVMRLANVPFAQVGRFVEGDRLTARARRGGMLLSESLDDLRTTWLRPLDW